MSEETKNEEVNLQILNQAMGDKQRSCDNNYRNSNKY